MKRRLVSVGVLVALVASLAVATTATAAPPTTDADLTVPITGSGTNDLGELVEFDGEFTLERFTTQGGQLAAVGEITGTLTNTVTGETQTVGPQQVTAPAQADGTCEILDLTLGPLDLDLLGLVVHLDQVHLNITAESGPGNLLGNLLCGVAGLLDGGAPANVIANILNRILSLL